MSDSFSQFVLIFLFGCAALKELEKKKKTDNILHCTFGLNSWAGTVCES